jgi:hypothetical protein
MTAEVPGNNGQFIKLCKDCLTEFSCSFMSARDADKIIRDVCREVIGMPNEIVLTDVQYRKLQEVVYALGDDIPCNKFKGRDIVIGERSTFKSL